MATTKNHYVKGKIGLSFLISYVTDIKKIKDKNLIRTVGCSLKNAESDFEFTRRNSSAKLENFAYHLIQSFAETDNITPDLAVQIAEETVKLAFENEYMAIMAPHQDTDNLHNHIILNSVSSYTRKAISNKFEMYNKFKYASDEICKKHGLSVIVKTNDEINYETGISSDDYIINIKGKDYNKKLKSDWVKTSNEKHAIIRGASWKFRIKKIIDTGIRNSDSFEDFLKYCESKNLEVKNLTKDGQNELKYIKFRLTKDGQEKFIYARNETLGNNYTREKIKERIKINNEKKDKYKHSPIKTKIFNTINEQKFIDNKALKSWATTKNIENMANMMVLMSANNITNIESLKNVISEIENKNEEIQINKNNLYLEINQLEYVLKSKTIMKKYESIYNEYINNPNNKFYMKHGDEIEKYNKAYASLTNSEKKMSIKSINNKLDKLKNTINDINKNQEKNRLKLKDLKQLHVDLNELMNIEDIKKEKNINREL